MLTSSSPLQQRIWAYLQERFPPVVYTVLVALFFGSAVCVGRAWDSSAPVNPWSALGGVVVLLAFLHLRLMDEFKDYERDCQTHPDRVLSRGIVSLALLKRMMIGAIALEAVLSIAIGWTAFLWWSAALGFSLLMRIEFGVGKWLSRHIVVYAITHNPVVALLAMFAWATTGAKWNWLYMGYVLMVSLGSLAFEIGRKMRLVEEEVAGVETYSSALGRERAGWLLRAVLAGTLLVGEWTVWVAGNAGVSTWAAVGVFGLGALWVLMESGPTRPAKRVDAACSVFLLLSFVATGVAAW